ncbi:MAG: VPLPA-CTERM sorting domain-containing protein [Sedimentitalea sp.]|nr:VPLPA-CTERM sorting domain-containing protein [Sedimentitalea sp.]
MALGQDIIEDLANLNLNYAIALGSNFVGTSFTLRVETTPVPLPAAAPLLLAGFGALGFAARRRRRRAA